MDKNDSEVLELGASVTDNGINFALYAKNKNNVTLNIYNNDLDQMPNRSFDLDKTNNKSGDIWHIFVKGLNEGTLYTWTVDDSPELLDPYALSYTNNSVYSKKKNIAVRKSNNSHQHLHIPLEDTIIYEAHVKFFTKDKSSQVTEPGTYSGFGEKIKYLKDLGITAVEFMPVIEWDDRTWRIDSSGNQILNIWGYNPINFFAFSKKFSSYQLSSSYEEINEFKHLVNILHKNGIEVILDLVYNHTAEGGRKGQIFNFKALDKENFYMLEDNKLDFKNYSGCGNTFNCNKERSSQIILSSLRYLYSHIGVDGFRFDLASILGRDSNGQWTSDSLLSMISSDPILKNAKLISESWDLGGYFLGDMPQGWCEWNGKYRDVIKKFIKADFDQIPELLKRIFGSPDLFKKSNKEPASSINYIASHDGFTMWDLVSYNRKHNEANGEMNNDGENNNFSNNWGEEGHTENPDLIAFRKKLIKNMFLILLISQGVPMFKMGDEMGHTQNGNNNPYCQDNKTTWIDWNRANDSFSDIREFVKNMIALRKKYKIFRKKEYLQIENDFTDDNNNGNATYQNFDITLHGIYLNKPDYTRNSLSIAFTLYDKDTNVRFHIALNSYHDKLTFQLPPLTNNKKWRLLIDTSDNDTSGFNENGKIIENNYTLAAKSCFILISK